MVDRVAQGPSQLPAPNSTKYSPCLLPNGTSSSADVVVPVIPSDSCSSDTVTGVTRVIGSENGQNGTHSSEGDDISEDKPKVPKANVPKELLIDKGSKTCIGKSDKGFETYLMTGDMMIKTNPSLKLRKDGGGNVIGRHHSDPSSGCEQSKEKRAIKRSASSPDQATLTGATVLAHDNITMDNLSKALERDSEENAMNRKESAESGFEEQAVHSDSGTLEKREKLSNDPTSVSDLSEVDSDDFLGTTMVGSQSSSKCGNASTVSTPSDLRSDVSVNTVLQQEIEPLLHENSSSSSSIDISSTESFSEDLSPEMIFERSLSDSGGMSPVYHKDVKSFLSSKSTEKIVVQKQLRQISHEHQSVRASKSQENYVGNDMTFVSIDIDDMAYSLDQIPQPVDPTPTKEDFHFPSSCPEGTTRTLVGEPREEPSVSDSDQLAHTTDERIFMPGFVKLSDSVYSDDGEANENSASANGACVGVGGLDYGDGVIHNAEEDAQQSQVDDTMDYGYGGAYARANVSGAGSMEQYEGQDMEMMTEEQLFALPPAKSVDHPSAMRLAKRLFNLDGFRKSDVSRHLCKKNEFNTAVAEEYLHFFDFSNNTLDVALRKFLKQFSLIGETQERERVLAHFSHHYLQCNPGTYRSEDACHTLVCALMLLNTDLHGQAVGRKMACNEFIENLANLNDGDNFPKDLLKALYHAIKAEPIEWAPDEDYQEMEQQMNNDARTTPAPSAPNLSSLPSVIGRNPFLDVPDPSQTTEYKKGYIMRKCCTDPDGRKTAMGKRGWKMFFVVLRDMILYLYKDEQALRKASNVGSHNAIRVHHCLASKATDYSKKQHVIRLQTSDWAEYLFQTSNTKECQEWIDILNFVAASLSAPPLPGAVGSQRKFQRPLLPATYTRLNMQDQFMSVEERLNQSELDLQDHRQFPPEKGSKSSTIQHFVEKETYLVYEVTRLKTYSLLLQSRLASHPELEPSLVETSIGEDEEGIKGVNPNQNNHAVITSPVSIKNAHVQRSISDRESAFGSPTSQESSHQATPRCQCNHDGTVIDGIAECTHL